MRRSPENDSAIVELAERVKPDLLVLYHRANAGGALTLADPEESLLSEIRQLYSQSAAPN